MIHATKPELESIIRDAANGLIAQAEKLAIAHRAFISAESECYALRDTLAATETEWRLCWWSSLAGCGLTLAGLWLGGAL